MILLDYSNPSYQKSNALTIKSFLYYVKLKTENEKKTTYKQIIRDSICFRILKLYLITNRLMVKYIVRIL